MSGTTPPYPPELEKAFLAISDQQMIFRSSEDTSTPKQNNKKTVLKTAKERLKLRRSTPAPPIKGDGRKRFDISPLPEDKQLCKRIDFGAAHNSTSEAPRCKSSIFPANPSYGIEESIQTKEEAEDALCNKKLEMVLFSPSPSIVVGNAVNSGHPAAAGEAVAGLEKDNPPSYSRSKVDGSADAKEPWLVR